MMNRSLLIAAIAIAATLLTVPASALAKSPPRGKYECVIGTTLFGEIAIKSSTKYRRDGKTGKYKAGSNQVKFSDGIVGYRLTFKTGALKGYKGRWHKTSDGVYEIALRNPVDDFESIYCDK